MNDVTTGKQLPQRLLGGSGIHVSEQGLGCFGMSTAYGPADDAVSTQVIHAAVDGGITFFDTAEVYGDGHNEQLVGAALASVRSQVVIATKFGFSTQSTGGGEPASVRKSCEGSLERLGTDYIDLYYQHRVDSRVPIEDTVGAMAELVTEGKVRALGLSEASAESLRRATAVHPIAALQSEWSLWTRDIEAEVLSVARELGISLVPYSPLGRGFLTGAVTTPDSFAGTDMRQSMPRFAADAIASNGELLEQLKRFAADVGCTPGQLALAWLLAQGSDVIPIPGTKRLEFLRDNLGASQVHLTVDQEAQLSQLMPAGAFAGARYGQAHSYGDSPLPA